MQPGTIGLTRIGGLLGWLIGFGQWLIRDGSRYTHVFVVLEDGETIVEAMPGGARLNKLSHYTESGGPLGFVRMNLHPAERERICYEARQMVGRPYGFANYFLIALTFFGIKPQRLTRYVASERSVICSQLADIAYARAGVQLFDDGRLSGVVSPGDLANLPVERDLMASRG